MVSASTNYALFASEKARVTTNAVGDLHFIGDIFHSRNGALIDDLSLIATGRPKGRFSTLSSDVWGSYFAIALELDGTVSVARDPSGFMPCYYLQQGRTLLLGSDARILLEVAEVPAKANISAIADLLLYPGHRNSITAIEQIRELPPGRCITFGRGEAKGWPTWNPWTFTGSGNTSFKAATVDLRRHTDNAFAAWSAVYPRTVTTVSGGLDSSIVASFASRQENDSTFLTLFTGDGLGDERSYSRIVAQAFGVPLHEINSVADDIDINFSPAAHLPRPTARGVAQSADQALRSLMATGRYDAIFNGYGGDNVFCFLQSATPLVDRLLGAPRPRALGDTLSDIIALTGASATEVLTQTGQTACRAVLRGPRYPWPRTETLLSRQTISKTAPDELHPWLSPPQGALPGKAVHIAMLIRTQTFMDRFPRSENIVDLSPLLSQPVMEACLAIPSWLWCAGGLNRAVARSAFADRLPAEIVSRVAKGSPLSLFSDVYDRERHIIAERLSDGFLARNRLIDPAAVRDYLALPVPSSGTGFLRILDLMDVECWADAWAISN